MGGEGEKNFEQQLADLVDAHTKNVHPTKIDEVTAALNAHANKTRLLAGEVRFALAVGHFIAQKAPHDADAGIETDIDLLEPSSFQEIEEVLDRRMDAVIDRMHGANNAEHFHNMLKNFVAEEVTTIDDLDSQMQHERSSDWHSNVDHTKKDQQVLRIVEEVLVPMLKQGRFILQDLISHTRNPHSYPLHDVLKRRDPGPRATAGAIVVSMRIEQNALVVCAGSQKEVSFSLSEVASQQLV